MAPYLAERGLTMNLIDRLIAKAQTIQLALGDNVFMIIREDVGWTVDGQQFPDLEAAQGYVEGLIPDNAGDCTVIINDAPPSPAPEPESRRRKRRERYIREYIAQKTKAENPLPPMPKKDRNLI